MGVNNETDLVRLLKNYPLQRITHRFEVEKIASAGEEIAAGSRSSPRLILAQGECRYEARHCPASFDRRLASRNRRHPRVSRTITNRRGDSPWPKVDEHEHETEIGKGSENAG